MRNPHFQTMVAARKPRRFTYGWNSWESMEIDLSVDGRIVAEASWQPGDRARSPGLFLLHGMEGSAQSHYLVGTSKKAYARGFHVIRVNTRNCGGARESIRAAAVLSAPIDLGAGARKIDERSNWIYQRYFVSQLIQRMRRKLEFFPGIADMRRVQRIRTIYEFDDVVTAPHFGYGSADEYYRKASAAPLLHNIRVPTLMIQAADDPLLPFDSFRDSGIEENPFLYLLATEYGGHAGFLTAKREHAADLDCYWAESRAVDFLSAHSGTEPDS
ncbi:MAG: hypothetical protein ABSC02_12130 [Acidobacteriota bacterium]|jgi:hypothetical protein